MGNRMYMPNGNFWYVLDTTVARPRELVESCPLDERKPGGGGDDSGRGCQREGTSEVEFQRAGTVRTGYRFPACSTVAVGIGGCGRTHVCVRPGLHCHEAIAPIKEGVAHASFTPNRSTDMPIEQRCASVRCTTDLPMLVVVRPRVRV